MNIPFRALHQLGKYCIVGAIGAITDFSIYTLLIKGFLINYVIANLCSITIALILVYFLQKNWTFRYISKNESKTFQRYLISVAITYILNNGTVIIFVSVLGYGEIISKIIQIIFSTIWGYALTNYFVFATKEKDNEMNV